MQRLTSNGGVVGMQAGRIILSKPAHCVDSTRHRHAQRPLAAHSQDPGRPQGQRSARIKRLALPFRPCGLQRDLYRLWVIDQRDRGQDTFAPMVLREVALTQGLGLRYVLAGMVLPDHAKHCQRHGECPAHDYCASRRGQHLLDPLLAMYAVIGFTCPMRAMSLPSTFEMTPAATMRRW